MRRPKLEGVEVKRSPSTSVSSRQVSGGTFSAVATQVRGRKASFGQGTGATRTGAERRALRDL